MNKVEFIGTIIPALKEMGYKKKRNYWFKCNYELVFCINVQGSQWCADDYYVNIGIALCESNINAFTDTLKWKIFHRCIEGNNQLNISPNALFCEMKKNFTISRASEIPAYIEKQNAKAVINQFWF